MPVTMLTSSVLIDARMPNVANMYTARIAAPARMIILGTSRCRSVAMVVPFAGGGAGRR